jgi:adenylyltransferase/sulfurtransferase
MGNVAVKVYIPTHFRGPNGSPSHIEVAANDVATLIRELDARFPGLAGRIVDGGRVHRHVNVYVNDQIVERLDAELRDGDEVAVIPAMAGGATQALAWGPAHVRRYARHLIMPEVGVKGQKKLAAASVVLIGAGGLGSPTAMYLAAAGVGRLGIIDFDVVDESNLQRQLLHGTDDVGRPKVESAADTLRRINPLIEVVPHRVRLSSENALEIFKPYDIIVDGADNFPTRYLANDASVLLGKPLVHGSIFRFEGQATVFMPGRGCYRCLFPAPPPPGAVPNCAEAGVLGVLPGIVGSIQAMEAIKLILGIGEPLVNRLILFDALAMEFREVKLRRDPQCPICGESPTITELIDYEQFCGITDLAQVGS